jgi:tetratricopeptide (TPR) repeat protein
MNRTRSRSLAGLVLASGLLLVPGGRPVHIAAAEQAPGQSAEPAPTPAQPGGNADAGGNKADDVATGHEMDAFFTGLLDAIHEKDSPAVSARIDTDQLCAEIQRQQIASIPTPVERTALRVALKMVVGDGLLEQAAAEGWRKFRVHRLAIHAEEPSVANVHMLNQEGRTVAFVRFWLNRDNQGAWKIDDWQEASSIFRTSSLVAMTLSAFREEPGAARNQRLLAAADAASRSDMAASERIVLELVNEKLSPALEGARWLLYAQIKFSQGEHDKALECLDQVLRYEPDLIALPKIKALIHAQLRNPARSLEYANLARDELGDDAELDSLIGNALAQLGRPEEASEAYRRGLKADPDFVENLVGLASVLPAGKKGEITDYLNKCSDVAQELPRIAEGLASAGDSEALEAVTAGAARLGADAALIDDCRARAAWLKGQPAEAAKLTESAINHAHSDEARRFYADRLLDIRVAAGQALEAYRASGEPEHAFTHMAARLTEVQQADTLLALANAHVDRLPTSPDGYFYVGRAQLLKQRYDDAAKALARGLSLAKPGPQHESLRTNLVYALYKSGRGRDAYREIAPRRATMGQLASLYLNDRQPQPLLDLLADHHKNDPADARTSAWEAQARTLLKDHAGAAKVLRTAIATTNRPERSRTLTTKLLGAHLAAKTPAEGYADAPDPEFAFRYLCERLVQERDVAGLNTVIKAHQARAPGDVLLHAYAGQADLLAGEYKAAEQEFSQGFEQAVSPETKARFLSDRLRARCHLGEALKTYNQSGDKAIAYRLLVPLLVELGRGDDLTAVVKAYRAVAPTEPSLGLWEAEARWMAGDYQGTVDVLRRDRYAILADSDDVSRYDDRLVRSLIRLKKFHEAGQSAKESTDRDGDPWFEAVVAFCSGEVDRSRTLLGQCAERGYTLADFDGDPDLGPVFKTPKFRSVRDTLTTSR